MERQESTMSITQQFTNPYFDEAKPYLKGFYFQERLRLVRKYSWAIPNKKALSTIADYASNGIIEIGAGNGYWAYCLTQKSIKVIAYDLKVSENPWHSVQRGDTLEASKHSDRTLFLCWPPYDEPMAADALRSYKGKTVIYVGEGYGGCTADDEFHKLLKAEWKKIKVVKIPQWNGIYDCLTIYQK